MSNVKSVLITGASGLIGTRLTTMLKERAHWVATLGRSEGSSSGNSFTWDVGKGKIDRQAIQSVDTIIHLAGEGIADKRWTAKRKEEILQSRTKSTQLLHNVLKEGNTGVKSFISASAIGFYGTDEEKTFKENDSSGNDFLAEVTSRWEDEVLNIAQLGIRVVIIRIGIVLSEKGGALKEIAKPVNWLVGAPLGSGDQYVSWIHINDVCGIFIKAVEEESLQGVYNAAGVSPVSNRELTRKIARVLHKPIILPAIPAWVLRLYLGEMADMVLGGSKVSSEKILKAGYQFRFVSLEKALQDLLTKA